MNPEQAQHASPETAIAVMSRDIHYMKESLGRLETLFADSLKNNVTRAELVEKEKDLERYKAEAAKCTDDHEKRIRALEVTVTRIVTWGSAGVLALGIAEFLISKLIH